MDFKNIKTGEILSVSRPRIYINEDGSKRYVDAATGMELNDDYEYVRDADEIKDFKNVKAKANPRDSRNSIR